MSKRQRATKTNPALTQTVSPTAQKASDSPEYYLSREKILLPYGIRGEQQEIDAWKELVTHPNFREDIKKVQRSLGASYWQECSRSQTVTQQLNLDLTKTCTAVLNSFERNHPNLPVSVRLAKVTLRHENEIEQLLQKWALEDLKDAGWWLEHLLRFWNPETGDLPPLEAPMRTVPLDLPAGSTYIRRRTPLFKKVIVSVEHFAPSLKDSDKIKPRRATVTLRPGVSLKQARHAVDTAVRSLASKPRVHRPGLTDLDRGYLRMWFGHLEPQMKARGRSQIIRQVYQQMHEWQRPISATNIGNEFRLWLKENGYFVRSYVTDRRDSRT